MPVNELKEKLHHLIDSTNNELLLESLLLDTEKRLQGSAPHELEGLSEADYNELLSLVDEEPEKDTITYDELKSSLGRWFIK